MIISAKKTNKRKMACWHSLALKHNWNIIYSCLFDDTCDENSNSANVIRKIRGR